ncbi:MAG: stage II sporulation protein M, partial [Armatimonadetes bacterium]|nr:stage II sporulation protein M [Armatimonadota bacterium]
LHDLVAVVAPHGVLELSAIFICAGAGLMMGWALVAPGDRLRVDALSAAAREAVVLVVGCIPVFLTAALIEGLLSPQTSGLLRTNEPRVLFGLLTGLVLTVYLFFDHRLPTRARSRTPQSRHARSLR